MNLFNLLGSANNNVIVGSTFATNASVYDVGTSANGITSVAPTYPAGITAGMDILIFVSNKLATKRPTTPTGYRRIDTWVASTANNGTDQGPISVSLFHKTAVGTETGTVTISLPGGTSALANIIVIQKDPAATLHYKICAGHHNLVGSTAYNAISYNTVDTRTNDLILNLTAVNCDTYAWSAQDLNYYGSSGSFTVLNQELFEVSTNQGNDQEQFVSVYRAYGDDDGYLVATATSSGASLVIPNPTGVTLFVRIRQSTEAFTWPPSGLRLSKSADWFVLSDTGTLGDSGPIGQGYRLSFEGPTSASDRYVLTTKDGRQVLKMIADITLGVNRRTEYSNAPWEPDYPIGTQIIEEIRFETDSYHNNPQQDGPNSNSLKEWIFYQNHSGRPLTGTYTSNNPLFYFAWSYAGQTGWDTLPGPSAGGEFVVSNNVSGRRERYPSITWQPNTVYRIRYHVCADLASGTPCLKVWVNDTLIYENYTEATVTAADADLGSRSNVLGACKRGVYHHGIENSTQTAANIAVGHKGVVLYNVAENRIIMFPGDIDYITDLTNNTNPIYDYVDTSEL
jgi:hypothetical protein